MECSLYNAERRKKPVPCTPKVGYFSLHFCQICSQGCFVPTLLNFHPPSALCRLIPWLHACAPCGRQRKSRSITPIRPAQLRSAVQVPGDEIPATASTQTARWSQTLMGRCVGSLFIETWPVEVLWICLVSNIFKTSKKVCFYPFKIDKGAFCLSVNRQQNRRNKATPPQMVKHSGRVKVAPGKNL